MASDWVGKQSEELTKLARARFGALSTAEGKLLRAVITGDYAWCGPSDDDNDPGNKAISNEEWGQKRTVRAELLCWLCVDPAAEGHVHAEGISLHGARISGELDLSLVVVRFPLRFRHCRLTSEVKLGLAVLALLDLSASSAGSISADGVKVKGDVFLEEGFSAKGEVSLIGAQIEGNLQCDGSFFSNPPAAGEEDSGTALNIQNSKVNGDVLLSDGFQAEGEVTLLGARIDGSLQCNGAIFRNPRQETIQQGGVALDADLLTVTHSVLLNEGFQAEGNVSLLGAEIGEDVDCEGGIFRNPRWDDKTGSSGGTVLQMDNAAIKGNVSLCNGFVAGGEVSLLGAQITGDLDCEGANVNQVNGQRMAVRHTLFWKKIVNPQEAALDLEDASAGSLVDDRPSWPSAERLALDGFTYGSLAEGPKDSTSRLEWLGLQKSFAPQPYRQLAKVLREEGDDAGARHVLYEMEKRKRQDSIRRWYAIEKPSWRERTRRWFARLWNPFFRLTIGYGIYPRQAVWGLALLVALGWGIYFEAYCAHLMAPTNKEAYKDFRGSTGQEPPGYYPHFYAFIYSAENCFPLVKLGQADAWSPDPNLAGCPVTALRWFRWAQTFLGWTLATFFVAGVTGIARKD